MQVNGTQSKFEAGCDQQCKYCHANHEWYQIQADKLAHPSFISHLMN